MRAEVGMGIRNTAHFAWVPGEAFGLCKVCPVTYTESWSEGLEGGYCSLTARHGEAVFEVHAEELAADEVPHRQVEMRAQMMNWLEEVHRYEALPRQESRIR